MKALKPVVIDLSFGISILRFDRNPAAQLSLVTVLRRIRALGFRVPAKGALVDALQANPQVAEDHLPMILITGSKTVKRKTSRRLRQRDSQRQITAAIVVSKNGVSCETKGYSLTMDGTTNFVVERT